MNLIWRNRKPNPSTIIFTNDHHLNSAITTEMTKPIYQPTITTPSPATLKYNGGCGTTAKPSLSNSPIEKT